MQSAEHWIKTRLVVAKLHVVAERVHRLIKLIMIVARGHSYKNTTIAIKIKSAN